MHLFSCPEIIFFFLLEKQHSHTLREEARDPRYLMQICSEKVVGPSGVQHRQGQLWMDQGRTQAGSGWGWGGREADSLFSISRNRVGRGRNHLMLWEADQSREEPVFTREGCTECTADGGSGAASSLGRAAVCLGPIRDSERTLTPTARALGPQI